MAIRPNRNWRLLSVMSLVLAMSGLVVQAAHAMPVDKGPYGTAGAQGFVPVDSRPLAIPIHGVQASVPVDSRAIVANAPQVSVPVDSRAIVANTPVVDATPSPVTASDSFNWGDARLGALSAFAVLLLAVSVMLVLRHNRNRLVGLHS
jgi:hypothetical protein